MNILHISTIVQNNITLVRSKLLNFCFSDLLAARDTISSNKHLRCETDYKKQLSTLSSANQRLEDLLANRNAKDIKAQQIHITDHAIHRYRKRIGFSGSNDELRRMVYKQLLRHMASMDSLPDGHYKINDKAAARVKDNTVATIVPATKRQS